MSIFSTKCAHCGSNNHATDECPHGFLSSECGHCGSKDHATDDCPHGFLSSKCGHCGSRDHATDDCPQGFLSSKCGHCGSREHPTDDCPHGFLSSKCGHCGSREHATDGCPHSGSGGNESDEEDGETLDDSDRAEGRSYMSSSSSGSSYSESTPAATGAPRSSSESPASHTRRGPKWFLIFLALGAVYHGGKYLSDGTALSTSSTTHGPGLPAPPIRTVAPSFDCAKATWRSERIVCSSQELSVLDVALSQAYRDAAARSPARAAELRTSENYWIRKTRESCADIPCLQQVYEERLRYLSRF
jgi:uncharacterized protein YecT (DUF1311 family)